MGKEVVGACFKNPCRRLAGRAEENRESLLIISPATDVRPCRFSLESVKTDPKQTYACYTASLPQPHLYHLLCISWRFRAKSQELRWKVLRKIF